MNELTPLISIEQLKVGFYLMDSTNEPREILEILPETPEKYGHPSVVSSSCKRGTKNVPPKLRWSTIREWKIFDPAEFPEHLL